MIPLVIAPRMFSILTYLRCWLSGENKRRDVTHNATVRLIGPIKEKKADTVAVITPQYLYALRYPGGGRDHLYKIGKTINLQQRLRAYRTLIPDGKWFYTVECTDMHCAEKVLHALLKQQGYHVQREIFRGDGRVITSTMNLVKELDRLQGTRHLDALVSTLRTFK